MTWIERCGASKAVCVNPLPLCPDDNSLRIPWLALLCAALLVAGCGGRPVGAPMRAAGFAVLPRAAAMDTNCTGCNLPNARGGAVQQFDSVWPSGTDAEVTWSVAGGDPVSGTGTIDANGVYTPPTYLTRDKAEVRVTATLKSNSMLAATATITLTPGFLQPLTPQNAALPAGAALNVTGVLAESGGNGRVHFALADAPTGGGPGLGALSTPRCERTGRAFTACTVTYTAPANVAAQTVTYIVATTGAGQAHTEAAILLTADGIRSSPATHQQKLSAPVMLGSSGGNVSDFDANGATVVDCCSGTLGALVQDGAGRRYVLSNNHVLARSDRATAGDAIVQPGLIDNNCTPNGAAPVGRLSAWLPLNAAETNVDAALAEVDARAVEAGILELGARQADGRLSAAMPGTSSSGGKGVAASLQMHVAKSGRTTGLTCGAVSAVDVDVAVDYFKDCAETRPYLTKHFTHQIAVSGNRFSDSGDSGALLVAAESAEPVGLYFAGGLDTAGVSQAMANPAPEVLNELETRLSGGLTFAGGADHTVSCLSYGDSTAAAAQARALSNAEIARVQAALAAARKMVNPAQGVLGVAMGKSTDHAGEAAVLVYVRRDAQPAIASTIDGVRTVIVPTTEQAMQFGAAPKSPALDAAPSSGTLAQAVAAKNRLARGLMQREPAFFAVGVGQSLDNPREAALVVYVDRWHEPESLPATMGGLRTRYVLMDRLHVTRGYGLQQRCVGKF